jgi:hypothetical protein
VVQVENKVISKKNYQMEFYVKISKDRHRHSAKRETVTLLEILRNSTGEFSL